MENELLKKYGNLPTIKFEMFGEKVIDVRRIPKWDIPEIVIIKVALCGAFVDKEQNPNQPYSKEEVLKEALECIEMGATSIHLHVRDEKGGSCGDIKAFEFIVNEIRKRYGDSIVVDGCAQFGENFEQAVAPVTQRLFEVSPVNPVAGFVDDNIRYVPPTAIKAQAIYFQEMGCKVQVSIHDTGSIGNARRFLIDTGILKKPYYWIILPELPGFFYMPHPIAMSEGLIFLVNRLREIDKDSIIMVCAAGRASSYITALSMVLGLHVRVGMEDTIWRHPHKDDLIKSNAEVVRSTIEMAKQLGRRVATAEEYRKLIGLKK